ncbi:hypothetical protein TIFTF001_045850 [Ficus carica]|uniref:Uncharacterized protein n=1 Tax=Ficus carica TaxID=3494 RepID=A0AA87Z2D0_FICCA|nr:hypothetical protein TIFTF001_045850 [Ficus carica]
MQHAPANQTLRRSLDHGREVGLLATGYRSELDLDYISRKKPKATIGGTRAGPSDTVCPGRSNTPEVPGPRRRNEAPCIGILTRVGLGIYFKEKTQGNHRRHPRRTTRHSLLR